MAGIARVVVPGACYVSRGLARRSHKRKVKIPKIKYGVPRISMGHIFNLGHGILPETSHEKAITMVNDVHEISSRMDR